MRMTTRYRVVQGGMRAGKTFAILQYLIAYAEQSENEVITVLTSTLPALKLGAKRDFEQILKETGHYIYFEENRTDNRYTCKATGSIVEFVGLEDEMKALGSSRTILFVNEANRISWRTFKALAARTSKFIFLDFNPIFEFWAHGDLRDFAGEENYTLEIFTYEDNEAIPPQIKTDIERQRDSGNWWRVYGQGLIGEHAGMVFSGWRERDERSEIVAYGLDFGFNPDPIALVGIEKTDEGWQFRELLHARGLTADEIVEQLKALKLEGVPIVADNARPEIIQAMRNAGLSAVPCIKSEKIEGKEVGRMAQIEMLRALQSVNIIGENLIKEYKKYSYTETRAGDRLPAIKKSNDHLIDALRYGYYYSVRSDKINDSIQKSLREYAV